MTSPAIPTRRTRNQQPVTSSHLPAWLAGVLIGLSLVVAGLGVYAELQHLLGCDVAWLLYLSQRVRHGAVLYRDLLGADPPLMVWAGIPLIMLEERWRIPLAISYRIAVLVILVVQAVLWWRLYDDLRPGRAAVLTSITIAAACLLPFHEFGQRDHLVAMLLWGTVLIAALRREGHSVATGTEIVAGVAAALACAMKPHYILAPLGLLYSSRRRPWRDPVILGGGIVLGIYGILVLAIAPDYLPFIRGLSTDYYRYFHQPLSSLLWGSYSARIAVSLIGAGAIGLLAATDRRTPGVLLRASILMLGIMILQGKGLGYHYIPALLSGTILVAFLLLEPVRSWRLFRLGWWARLATAAALTMTIGLLTAMSILAGNGVRWGYEVRHDVLKTLIEQTASHGSLLMVSPILQDGFPLVLNTGVDWRLPSPSAWGLLAAGDSIPRPGTLAAATLREISEALESRPDLVLIRQAGTADGLPGEDFDMLRVIQRDSVVHAVLSAYRRLPDTVHYAVFVHR